VGLLGGLVLAAAVGGGCATTARVDSVEDLIFRGRYTEAVELAERRARKTPVDEDTKRALQRARVALLLDRARAHNFADEYAASLTLLEEAESILPGQPQVAEWRDKNLRELALYYRDVAREAESSGDFDAAYLAYLESARLDPDEPAGRNGAERVLLRDNYRQGLGKAYYQQGVKRLREYRTIEAVQDLDSAEKYLDEDPRLADRQDEAAELLAEERVQIAGELEQQGLFRAARNEYRLALMIQEDQEEALEGLERCEREVQVLEFLSEAERELRRKDFDQALVRVERAAQITRGQQELVAERRAEVEAARVQALYDTARELESDFEFNQAVSAYERLLEETGGFYEDSITRRDTLLEYLELAPTLYQRANQAETLEEQEALLYQITLFWPTYRDVRQRYRAVSDRLAEEQAEAEAEAAAGDEPEAPADGSGDG
jgi:tetratricopeptide (TPR) repeat protein